MWRSSGTASPRRSLFNVKPRTSLTLSAVIAAAVISGCQSVPARPNNADASLPSCWSPRATGGRGLPGVAIPYLPRLDLHRDRLGDGSEGGCDPAGGAPTGGGVGSNDHGVVVSGITGEASAVSAVVCDASGLRTTLTLLDAVPTVPRAKIAVANLGPDAKPAAIDFFDASGAKVDSTTFP